MADVYVENPADYVKLHEYLEVEVIQLDVERGRIGLRRLYHTIRMHQINNFIFEIL